MWYRRGGDECPNHSSLTGARYSVDSSSGPQPERRGRRRGGGGGAEGEEERRGRRSGTGVPVGQNTEGGRVPGSLATEMKTAGGGEEKDLITLSEERPEVWWMSYF